MCVGFDSSQLIAKVLFAWEIQSTFIWRLAKTLRTQTFIMSLDYVAEIIIKQL